MQLFSPCRHSCLAGFVSVLVSGIGSGILQREHIKLYAICWYCYASADLSFVPSVIDIAPICRIGIVPGQIVPSLLRLLRHGFASEQFVGGLNSRAKNTCVIRIPSFVHTDCGVDLRHLLLAFMVDI